MKLVSLFYFARVKPLAAWSLSGSLLGVAMAGYLSHWNIVDVVPTALAAVAVVLMQYVAHPMNDIMDYELDRQAPIGETGRVKPLVDGMINQKETKLLNLTVVLTILVIISYLVWLRPILILPASYGLMALIGYNSKSLRLAYRPYSELYLSMPINALTVLVISYIGSGQVSPIAVAVSVSFGFAASSFFLSMMSMDFPTDRKNGKRTTIVVHPTWRWCTYYPLIGLAFTLVSGPFLVGSLGVVPTTVYVTIAGTALASIAFLGSKVDALRMEHLAGKQAGLEGLTGSGRLSQLYLSVVSALSLAVLFAYLGM